MSVEIILVEILIKILACHRLSCIEQGEKKN